MPDTIAGLPAHPLVVHLPVVLIPLVLLTALLSVVWRTHRRPLALVTLAGAALAFAGSQLATMSGETLEERVGAGPLVARHAQLGEATRTLAFATLIVAAAWFARAWLSGAASPGVARLRRAMAPRSVGVVLAVALILLAATTTVWDVRTGHAGAEAAWGDLPAAATTGPG